MWFGSSERREVPTNEGDSHSPRPNWHEHGFRHHWRHHHHHCCHNQHQCCHRGPPPFQFDRSRFSGCHRGPPEGFSRAELPPGFHHHRFHRGCHFRGRENRERTNFEDGPGNLFWTP